MANLKSTVHEGGLAMKFAGVSLLGFATDYSVLHVTMAAGMHEAFGRIISLFCAMQVTFLVNGLHVFRTLDRARPWRQWATYMCAHGCGNFCNYWIFVTLVSTHWRVVSSSLFALAAGSAAAVVINYSGARFLVFRKRKVVSAEAPPA